jgi:hypothetical protein
MGRDPVNGFELNDQRTRPRKKPFPGSDPMDGLLVDGGASLNGEHLLFVREVRESLS